MPRNFGVNLSRKRAPSAALQSSLQRASQPLTVVEAIGSQVPLSQSFDNQVNSALKSEFKQRAEEHANGIAAQAGIASSAIEITEQSCEQAYQTVAQWLDYIDSFVPALESAAVAVNGSAIASALQDEFDSILSAGRRGAINVVKDSGNAISAAADTTGLSEVYAVVSDLFELISLDAYDGVYPIDVLPYVNNLSNKIISFTNSLDDLEETLDSSLILPTPVSLTGTLPPLAKLVNPSAFAAATGEYVGEVFTHCETASLIGSIALGPISTGYHNALGAAGKNWIQIAAPTQLGSEAPWTKVQSKVTEIEAQIAAGTDFAGATAIFEAIGGILSYAAEQLGEEPDDPAWYDIFVEAYEWGQAVFQALGGNFTALAGEVLSALNENLRARIVEIEKAHVTIFQEVVMIPTKLAIFVAQGRNYTPDPSLVSQYLETRHNSLTGPVSDLLVAANASLQQSGLDVVQAIKTLVACCYYNQSVYFWKTGVPAYAFGVQDEIPPYTDTWAYEKWKAATAAMEREAGLFQQAVKGLEILEEGVPTYLRETVVDQVEPIFERDDVRISRDDIRIDTGILDRVRQRSQYRPRKRVRQRRDLGSILPAQNPALYPVGLAILAYIAYRHLQGK